MPIPNDHVPFWITPHKFVFVTPIDERGHANKYLKFLKVSYVSLLFCFLKLHCTYSASLFIALVQFMKTEGLVEGLFIQSTCITIYLVIYIIGSKVV